MLQFQMQQNVHTSHMNINEVTLAQSNQWHLEISEIRAVKSTIDEPHYTNQ